MQHRLNSLFAFAALVAPCLAWAAGTTNLAPNGDLIPNGAPTASTAFSGGFNSPQAVDNLISAANGAVDQGLIFAGSEAFDAGQGPNQQLFAVSGFNSPISEIWLYSITSDPLRVPGSVKIRSSTTVQTSLNAGDYPTVLQTNLTLGVPAFTHTPQVVDPVNDPGYPFTFYTVIPVNAPAGTQSLFFDFDASATYGGNGARIQEVQAFFVPEPASLGSLLLGGCMLRRRSRSSRA